MHSVFGASVELLPVAFFGVGDTELLLIMTAVLIFFGGKKMPEFARGMGKALREFKRATGEVEREFKRVLDEVENPPPPPYTPAAAAVPALAPESAASTTPALSGAEGTAPVPPESVAPFQPQDEPAVPPSAPETITPPARPAPPRRPPEEQEYHSDV